MLIQNFDQLATSQLRTDALNIVNAGLEAVNSHHAIESRIKLTGNLLTIDHQEFDLSIYQHIYLLGIGKAACAASDSLQQVLGDKLTAGFSLGTHQGNHGKVECLLTSHPLPTQQNVEAAKKAVGVLSTCASSDLVITLITGGGSAMFCYPDNCSVGTEDQIISTLNKSGATIDELNTVRKHLSKVKGGQLVSLVNGAQIIALIFSDVPGNDLSVIASGPTVFDPTTVADAQAVLNRYQVLEKAGIAPFPLTETPKDPHLFSRVTNILFVTNQIATQAMGRKARELGYTIKDYSEFLEGEARTAGGQLQNELAPKTSVIAAGETTVKVIGHGRGGRNQELVLGSLARIQPNQVLISIGSDGIDNSTQFAGALADTITIETAAGLNLSPADFLDNNDSTAFFEQTNAGIITGKLPSNVSDLMLALQS